MAESGWTTVRRGRVRGAAQGPGWVGGAEHGAAGPRGPQHGGRPRTQLKPRDTRANVNTRPNTVVIECQVFDVLPPEHELALFLYNHVLTEEANKDIFKEVQTVFCDKNARRYLLKMSNPVSTGELGNLLSEGVAWPEYKNETGQDVIVKGYSMDKPIMDITISGVGWWTGQEVIMKVVETWGEVKKISKEEFTIHGQTISTGNWKLKLIKKNNIMIPPVVFHAGSERSSEEREMWEIFYRGVPKVCYQCLKPGHLGRDCREDPVNLEQLASQPEYEEAPAAVVANQEEGVGPRTFAQIVAEPSYTNARVARQQAAELKREAAAAKLREEEQQREKRKKEREEKQQREKENRRKEREERKKGKLEGQTSESESDEDDIADIAGIAGPGKEGFCINRSGEADTWAEEMDMLDQNMHPPKPKRAAESPAALVPEKKSVKLGPSNRTSSPVDSRRLLPPGNR